VLDPGDCLAAVATGRGDPDLVRKLLQNGPSFLERALVYGLARPEEAVEGDVARGHLGRQAADPALGRVQAQLQGVEVEPPLALEDDLAVERRARRKERADLLQLGEVAKERSSVPAPDREPSAQILDHSAEAVPLRLVLPVALGQLRDELSLHRREGKIGTGHGNVQ
jgi:hypothetical protein